MIVNYSNQPDYNHIIERLLPMKYLYNPSERMTDPTFLLLHGTGGTERDLLPIAQDIKVNNGILAVKGNVDENGNARFFKRFADGSPDLEDMVERTNQLNEFVNETAKTHDFDRENVIALGYSNGANIATSLLFHHEASLKGAILLHPFVPRKDIQLPDLTDVPIFISAGATDTLVLPGEAVQLKKMLEQAGANVKLHLTDAGHALVESEIEAATEWYEAHFG